MSTDQAPLSIIPEQQQTRFDDLMGQLRSTHEQTPGGANHLLELASMVLSGVPILSDAHIRERAKRSAQFALGQPAQMRLIGDMNGHTDFIVEFGKKAGESDFLSLQRKSGDQTIEFSLAFSGHEFQGASLSFQNTVEKNINHEEYLISRHGLLYIKNGSVSREYEGRPVNTAKLTNSLVNNETRLEPLAIKTLFTEIMLPPSAN